MTLDPDEILARIDGTVPLIRLPVAAEKPFVDLREGDCREVLKELDDNSVDSVVTDPPYALTSVVKRFGKAGSAPAQHGSDGLYARKSRGFMGKTWDTGDVAHDPEFWRGVMRVLKPGGHVLAFGGTRTYHRLACAIEDAGFEIRDQIGWAFGSGFPHSHNLEGEFEGYGTHLKPAWEPICVARKVPEGTNENNMRKWGVGCLNIDGCRVPTEENLTGGAYAKHPRDRAGGWQNDNRSGGQGSGFANGGAGAYEQPKGRWPANLLHDGSDEVLAGFPNSKGQQGDVRGTEPSGVTKDIYGKFNGRVASPARNDSGSAARFFYCAKSSKADRNEGLDSAAIVSISVAWENADREVTLQVAMGTSRPKVTAVSGASTSSASEWSTLLFGSPPTGLYQTALKSITETKIRSTIASTIFASFLTFGTSESIPAAISTLTGLSGSPAESAEHTGLSLTITSEKMASALGANRAALPMRLKLSVSVAAVSSTHPTVKPTPLMQYLTRLVTPPGGIVLDPFMGSGSTGRGAVLEGFSFIGIEMDAAYYDIADARIAAVEKKVGRGAEDYSETPVERADAETYK